MSTRTNFIDSQILVLTAAQLNDAFAETASAADLSQVQNGRQILLTH
jgi:hypothetical protein